MALRPRRGVPLVGFSWGFDIANGQLEIRPGRQLSLEQWNAHTNVLRAKYQLWTFADV